MSVRFVYRGPDESDKDRWPELYREMPQNYQGWIDRYSRQIYHHGHSTRFAKVRGIGKDGSVELMTKLLVFLVNEEAKE